LSGFFKKKFSRLASQRFDEVENDDNSSDSSRDSSDESDSDSDDDDINIQIDARTIDPSTFKHVPLEDRSTHFVAIRITEKEIVENAIKVQQHIVRQEEVGIELITFC